MFPERTELLLIGCSIESIWTPKSKSNTLTPNTNSQTYWPRVISHVMNGIIFCVCLTLAISVLQSVLKWCRKENKKNQVKKESQQNRSRWWIWSREAAKGILTCLLLLHQKAQGKPEVKVKLFWVRKLRSTIERRDRCLPSKRSASIRHWRQRNRIRFVVRIQIILAQGEWSSAKPILKRCNKRQRGTFCDMVNVHVFNTASICIHGEDLLTQLAFHQKYRKRSLDETDVRHIWEIHIRTISCRDFRI